MASSADDTDVNRTFFPRLGRVVATCVALALFLIGSNYCVIGAVRGTAMACTSLGMTQSVKGESAAPICPLHAKRSQSSKDSKGAPQGSAPCCVTLTRVDAPEVPKIAADPMSFATFAVLAVSLDAQSPAFASLSPPSDDPAPAPGWEKCAHAGRAPPTLA